jgi:ribonuclease VapC
MIAVDSSAIVAIMARERGYEDLCVKLEAADAGSISTSNLLEVHLVVEGKRAIGGWSDVEDLLAQYAIAPRPFDERQLRFAREASLRYGKGRHKAALNFGDCFAYALAKSEGIPLLCTGTDFAQTDVMLA